MTSNAEKIRLAIALSALKFKPPNQSFASYVLDLRSKFPLPASEDTNDNSWRDLALSLERDYAVLQVKYEAEQIKSLTLENAASSLPSASPNQSSEPPPSSKKRTKKKTRGPGKPPPNRLNLKSVFEGLQGQPGFDIPTAPQPNSLFSALNDVLNLCSLPKPRPDLLLSVTTRVVEASAHVLQSIVYRSTPNAASDPNTLESLELILHTSLSTVLPLVIAALPETQSYHESTALKSTLAEDIVHLFERVTTIILNDLIAAFNLVTEQYIRALFTPTNGATDATTTPSAGSLSRPPDDGNKPKHIPADVRTAMLSLFRTIFCSLDTQSRSMTAVPSLTLITPTLRSSLILETVRALEKLFYRSSPAHSPSGPGGGVDNECQRQVAGRSHRVNKLIRKDALWYYCAILYILFSESSWEDLSQSHTVPVSYPPPRYGNIEGVDAGCSERQWGKQRETESSDGDERLLDDAVANALFSLFSRCKRTTSDSILRQTQTDSDSGLGVWAHCGTAVDGVGRDRLQKESSNEERERPDSTRESKANGDEETMGGRSCDDVDMGVDVHLDIGINITRQTSRASGTAQSGILLEASSQTAEVPGEHRDKDGTFELDEIGYEMLLGVVERYWMWSNH